jgi:hypothetical protein
MAMPEIEASARPRYRETFRMVLDKHLKKNLAGIDTLKT